MSSSEIPDTRLSDEVASGFGLLLPITILVISIIFFATHLRRKSPGSSASKPEATSPSQTSDVNEKWIMTRRPQGRFNPSEDVRLDKTETLSDLKRSCPEGSLIVRVDVLSVDAFVRTMLDEGAYHNTVSIGGTIPALGEGVVVFNGNCDEKTRKKFPTGTAVAGLIGANTLAVVGADGVFPKLTIPYVPRMASMGLLSVTTGLTAYAGIFYAGRPPRKGDTVVVSAASGAVGHIAAQLAKTTGARVIGIAGTERKTKFLTEKLGLYGAIDYKSDTSVRDQLEAIVGKKDGGVDFFFDNVGGDTLDAVMEFINPGGRVVICGAISQYSGNLNVGKVQGPSSYLKLAERGATMSGFNVMQYMMKIPFMMFWMLYYYLRGKVTVTEQIEYGIESFPNALAKIFDGGHIGKMIVDVTGCKPI